jgi:hypothetical protein
MTGADTKPLVALLLEGTQQRHCMGPSEGDSAPTKLLTKKAKAAAMGSCRIKSVMWSGLTFPGAAPMPAWAAARIVGSIAALMSAFTEIHTM